MRSMNMRFIDHLGSKRFYEDEIIPPFRVLVHLGVSLRVILDY